MARTARLRGYCSPTVELAIFEGSGSVSAKRVASKRERQRYERQERHEPMVALSEIDGSVLEPPHCGDETHARRGRLHTSLNQLARTAGLLILIGPAVVCLSAPALGQDNDDNDDSAAKKTSQVPNIYLDLNTVYTAVPANSFPIGFRPSLVPSLSALQPTPSTPAVQGLAINMPLTVDLNDRVSVYGGISTSMSQVAGMPWTEMTLDSWNVGFQADVYQQKGGTIPTITVQSTLTRSIAVPATSTVNIVEADYALNEDETKGVLAGLKYSTVSIDSGLARIEPAIVAYGGGYYQWSNNWKLIGRFGVQSFGGVHVAGLTPVKPFTLPILRFDLDRMDDNDNRLFGIWAEVAWTPHLAVQLTLRTPLYFVRH